MKNLKSLHCNFLTGQHWNPLREDHDYPSFGCKKTVVSPYIVQNFDRFGLVVGMVDYSSLDENQTYRYVSISLRFKD